MRTACIALLLLLASCQSPDSADRPPGQAATEWIRVRTALTLRNAAEHIRARNLDAARHELETAVLNNRADERVHILLAKLAIEEGRFDAVEPHLRCAQRLKPDLPDVHVVRGLLAEVRGRWGAAASAYGRATERFPHDERLVIAHARAMEAAGQPVAADAMWNRRVASRAPSTAVLQATAERELRAGRARQALAWYERGLAQEPDSAALLHGRVLALHALGRHAEVVGELRHRVRADDPSPVQLALARSALVEESYDIAIRMFQAHLGRNPRDVDAWLDLARTFFLVDRRRETREALTEALALRPQLGPAVLLKAHLAFREGRWAAALADYQLASQHGAADPGTLERLMAAARIRLGGTRIETVPTRVPHDDRLARARARAHEGAPRPRPALPRKRPASADLRAPPDGSGVWR